MDGEVSGVIMKKWHQVPQRMGQWGQKGGLFLTEMNRAMGEWEGETTEAKRGRLEGSGCPIKGIQIWSLSHLFGVKSVVSIEKPYGDGRAEANLFSKIYTGKQDIDV